MTISHAILALIVTHVLISTTALIAFWHRSRQWTGPSQTARLDGIDRRVTIVEGNYIAVDRDIQLWRDEERRDREEILRQLNALANAGPSPRRLHADLQRLEEKVDKIEQEVASLPCFLGSRPKPPECEGS
jgi:hypothetical protein